MQSSKEEGVSESSSEIRHLLKGFGAPPVRLAQPSKLALSSDRQNTEVESGAEVLNPASASAAPADPRGFIWHQPPTPVVGKNSAAEDVDAGIRFRGSFYKESKYGQATADRAINIFRQRKHLNPAKIRRFSRRSVQSAKTRARHLPMSQSSPERIRCEWQKSAPLRPEQQFRCGPGKWRRAV